MNVTFADLLNDSLSVLQVLSPDVTLTAHETEEGMRAFNALIESYSNDNLKINAVTSEIFNLVAGTRSYTIGTGGVFNTTRPTEIIKASVTVSGSGTVQQLEYPVAIVDYDSYALISMKNLSNVWPSVIYTDAAYPLSTLSVYPVPNQNYPITLYSYKPLVEITNLTDVITLPNGYYRWLKYAGAVELAPTYQTSAGPEVLRLMNEAARLINNTNAVVPTMNLDPNLLPNNRGGQSLTGVLII